MKPYDVTAYDYCTHVILREQVDADSNNEAIKKAQHMLSDLAFDVEDYIAMARVTQAGVIVKTWHETPIARHCYYGIK